MAITVTRSAYAIYDDPEPEGVPAVDVDPFSAAYFEDPFPAQAAVRDAGPFVWLSRYGVGAVARYDSVREVLNNWQHFCSSRGVGMEDFVRHGRVRLPSLILEADPPEHNRARGVLSRVLSPPVLASLRPGFEAAAAALVDEVVARGTIDGVADLAREYPLRVFPAAIGMRRDRRDQLLAHAEALFNSFGPRNELFQRSAARADFEWIEAEGRRENLLPGGLGMMIHEAADRGEASAEEAPVLVRALLQAGLDTTINALGATLSSLAANPGEWDRLRADPSLARNAFEEAIRLESPVQVFFRTATRSTAHAGVPVKEGDKILMMLGAANRDPRRWHEPDRYDITRKTVGHVGLGLGIHACVGQLLARLEGELLLKALASRVRAIRPTAPPTRFHNNTLRGLATLPLELIPA